MKIPFNTSASPVATVLRRRARQSGMALVVTLALMVLMTFLVVAFLSKAQRARQAEGASAAGAEAGDLVRSAADIIISDLQKEIVAGSDNKGTNTNPVYWPKNKDNWSPQNKTFSSSKGSSLLVKQSQNKPFFDYGGDPSITGSTGDKTDVPSRNWRTVPAERWDKPRLIADESLTQAGTFASGNLPEWINISAEKGLIADAGTNRNPVTGRFAYNVYDLSGLPDITVAGRPEDNTADDVYAAARIDFAGNGSFETVPGVIKGKWDEYMWWRFQESFSLNGTGQGEMAQGFPELSRWAAELGGGPLHPYDPNNATVRAAKEKRLYSRQDLIRYIEAGQSGQGRSLETDILPFVRTHSAASNAPMWWPENPTDPDFDSSNFNYRGMAEDNSAVNRFLPGVTVKSGFTRRDGSEAKSGDPLLTRRFPLSKLDLVATENATRTDAKLVEDYFGLRWDEGNKRWTYEKFTDFRIRTLDEVADVKREPNFFELLKAGMLSGSLGMSKDSTDLYVLAHPDTRQVDNNPDQQIFEIGASIIDQYDSDDIPTVILAPEGLVFGMENHPYISQMFLSRFRRRDIKFDRGNRYNPQPVVTAFVRFQMWNPHANAQEDWENPKDSNKNRKSYRYRIVSNKGVSRVAMFRSMRGISRLRQEEDGLVHVVAAVAPQRLAEELRSPAVSQSGRSIEFNGGVDSFAQPRVLASVSDPDVGTARASPGPGSSENIYTVQNATMVGMWMGNVEAANNWEGSAYNGSAKGTYFFGNIGLPNPYIMADGTLGDGYYPNDYYRNLQPEFDLILEEPLQYDLEVDMGDGWRKIQRTPLIDPNPRAVRDTNLIARQQKNAQGKLVTIVEEPLIANVGGTFGNKYRLPNAINANGAGSKGEWVSTFRMHINPLQSTVWANYDSLMRSDPRTFRFEFLKGRGYFDMHEYGDNYGEPGVFSLLAEKELPIPLNRTGINTWSPGPNGKNPPSNFFPVAGGWFEHPDDRPYGPAFRNPDDPDGTNVNFTYGIALAEFMFNSRDRSCWYKCRDGVPRLGDWGNAVEPNGDAHLNPMGADVTYRPVILNRPFRSVAELGYAFRGEPWKSINFHGNDTADAGLLDLFSVADSDTVKGRINPNKASVNTLRAMIHEAVSDVMDYELDDNPGSGGILGPQETDRLARALRQRLDAEPLEQVSQIPAVIDGILAQEKDNLPDVALWAVPRTSLARALADNADLRTWELLIDVIAQAGRFPTALGGNAGPGDFVVEGEERLWVHVSIDRLTGKVLDTRIETVQE